MAKHRKQDYQYPCAVIRGNELTLLSVTDLHKVVEAASVQSAMNLLHDFGYGDGKDLANPRDFEVALAAEKNRVAELVQSLDPNQNELEFLKFPADYHNAKVLLKAESLGINPENYLMDGGRVAAGDLELMVKERNFLFTPVKLRDAILEAFNYFATTKDPQGIDILLDQACYREMLECAEAVDVEFISGYVKLLIDILNVQIFVRLKEIGKSVDFFSNVFLPGGKIDLSLLRELYGEGYQHIGEKLDLYGFGQVVGRGAAEASAGGSFALMEKLADDLKIKYVQTAKYVTAGVEPILAFYVAKEMELKNLRMILTGKLVGIAEETLKERLRETYV